MKVLPSLIQRWAIAWVVGAVASFLTIGLPGVDGMISFVTQLAGAVRISSVCVPVCAIVGLLLLPLRRYRLIRFWNTQTAVFLTVLSVVLILYALYPEQLTQLTAPDAEQVLYVTGVTAFYGYIILIFTVANWPVPSAASPRVCNA